MTFIGTILAFLTLVDLSSARKINDPSSKKIQPSSSEKIALSSLKNATAFSNREKVNNSAPRSLPIELPRHHPAVHKFQLPSLNNTLLRGAAAPTLYKRTREVGGGGGSSFDDSGTFFSAKARITSIEIRYGRVVDAVNVAYSNGASANHGGSGGRSVTIRLAAGERITRITGRSGRLLDSIKFYTNIRSYGPYGGGGGHAFDFNFGSDSLVYVFGRNGRIIDRIGFGYGPQPCPVRVRVWKEGYRGGNGGGHWDDLSGNNAERRITSIIIHHGRVIDSIQVNYGSDGRRRGGGGGHKSVLNVGPNESIVKVEGRSGRAIDQLRFFFDSGRVSPTYGGGGGHFFRIERQNAVITAFYGRSGRRLDRLGAYTISGLPYKLEMLSIDYDTANIFLQPGAPQDAKTVILRNNNAAEQQIRQSTTISGTTSSTVTSSFSVSNSITVSFSATFKSTVVEVTSGITVGTTFENSFSNSKTVSETYSRMYTFVVNVAPFGLVRATAVARTAKYDLPYTSSAKVWYRGNPTPETIVINGIIKGLAVQSIEATYD